ncbi:MAG: AraC family transcriptional regulator [Eubacteriales bacterium]|nr:AraC family transcriptional regulator [Eubacteriales bacterium]
MFEDIINGISIIVYGRALRGKTWTIDKRIGVNRVYFIHSGRASFYMGNRTLPITPGNIYLFPRNIEFNIKAEDECVVDHTFFDFYLNTCSSDEIIEVPKDFNGLIRATADALIYIAENKSMFSERKRNEFYEPSKAYLASLIFLLMKVSDSLTFLSDTRILEALAFMQKNMFSKISVSDVAGYVNLDYGYFIKLFKKNMHISPYQYIKNYRLNRAISLIKNGKSVGEAAEAAGYDSEATFSHTVKKYTGMLPSELKNTTDI